MGETPCRHACMARGARPTSPPPHGACTRLQRPCPGWYCPHGASQPRGASPHAPTYNTPTHPHTWPNLLNRSSRSSPARAAWRRVAGGEGACAWACRAQWWPQGELPEQAAVSEADAGSRLPPHTPRAHTLTARVPAQVAAVELHRGAGHRGDGRVLLHGADGGGHGAGGGGGAGQQPHRGPHEPAGLHDC